MATKKSAVEARQTHFGSKSAPKGTPHHFFRWPKGAGVGEGKCIYCGVGLMWEERGTRGGKVRRYKVKGKWSSTEPPCKRKAA
jgi:hypothetical protein